MYICPNCNKQSETPINFCPNCGTTMVLAPTPQIEVPEQAAAPKQPVYAEPQYAQPTYENPAYSQQQFEQPQYSQPQQPVYEQPQYTQPQQPVYEQPQYTQPQQPMYTQPQYGQPMYGQPQYAPQTGAPSKAKAIVGMALGAAGLFFAVLGFFYTVALIGVEGAAALGMSIGFGMFSFPLSLVGLILSSKTRSAGDMTVFSKLGKIFGLVGVILSVVTFIFGLIGMAAGDTYYSDYDYYEYY